MATAHNSDIPPLTVIAGPTASGKSAMALELAERLGGEIVSVDSMQLYRALPIGTAQPTAPEQRRVPHHLVGIYELSERAEVFTFVELADRAIQEIAARGHVPILCGGTGLYLHALLYGLDPLPGDAELKRRLDAEYDAPERLEDLQNRLRAAGDAPVLEKFGNNRRRLIRALEIRLLTGRSILELQSARAMKLRYPLGMARRLEWPREVLRERIARRTRIMLETGWIEEARRAIAAGLLTSPTAHQALGYKIIARHLNGELPYAALADAIATATWQYARRQCTWFRGQHPELGACLMA